MEKISYTLALGVMFAFGVALTSCGNDKGASVIVNESSASLSSSSAQLSSSVMSLGTVYSSSVAQSNTSQSTLSSSALSSSRLSSNAVLSSSTVQSSIAQSSSVLASSSSIARGTSSGTLTDSRDGKTYRTVVIGTQTWMAENLDYDTLNGTGSWCYNDSISNCNIYGRLYEWTTAMSINSSYLTTLWNDSSVQKGLCPSDWHVPSNAEWETLVNFVGKDSAAIKLMAKANVGLWNTSATALSGTDILGFSALPGGYYGQSYSVIHDNAFFWSATNPDASHAFLHSIMYNYPKITLGQKSAKYYGYSIRCVQD